jgi:hypothetical protein
LRPCRAADCAGWRVYRANVQHALIHNQLTRTDLEEPVACFNPVNQPERTTAWIEEEVGTAISKLAVRTELWPATKRIGAFGHISLKWYNAPHFAQLV